MPWTKEQVGELIALEVYDHCTAIDNRILPLIEPEFDDEGTTDLLMLDRWQDRRAPKEPSTWTDKCPIENWSFDQFGRAVRGL